MQIRVLSLILIVVTLLSCKKNGVDPSPVPPITETTYFPPISGSEWTSKSPASLSWNETALNDLYTYLQSKSTKAFLILKNGRIVSEKYFGTFTVDSNWYWASAGKTMTAFLVGIAQNEGLININNRSTSNIF